jgi:hypothetical protein
MLKLQTGCSGTDILPALNYKKYTLFHPAVFKNVQIRYAFHCIQYIIFRISLTVSNRDNLK